MPRIHGLSRFLMTVRGKMQSLASVLALTMLINDILAQDPKAGIDFDAVPDGVHAFEARVPEAALRFRLLLSQDLMTWAPIDSQLPNGGWVERPAEGWEPMEFSANAIFSTFKRAFLRIEYDEKEAGALSLVPVGDPGNPNDTRDGDNLVEGIQQFGAVSSAFHIGTFEVTNAQYVAFLNAVAATADPHQLFHPSMASDDRGGILSSSDEGTLSYEARSNMGDKPVNFVSFWDACRFCNWLHNDRPQGDQTVATTETGAYDLTDEEAIANNSVVRQPGARFFLPDENEWYKAAFYDPTREGDIVYWLYPTRSDETPNPVTVVDSFGNILSDFANVANYNLGANWNNLNGHLTTVGSGGPGSASHYGAFDMAGNILEWNEGIVDDTLRGLRGGSLFTSAERLQSGDRDGAIPTFENVEVGFRIATP